MINWTPSRDTILHDMVGSRLQEFTVGKSAIALDFVPRDPLKSCVFRLKTAAFFSSNSRKSEEYEFEIRRSLPILYQQIHNTLEIIQFDGTFGFLRFSGDISFVVEDFEKIWDTTFSVEIRNFSQPADFLF
jgi:hypothetical protein